MSDYRLLQQHKIDHVLRDPGYVAEGIPRQLGEWWVEQGIAERVEVTPAPPAVVKAITAPAPIFMPAPVRRFRCCGWKK